MNVGDDMVVKKYNGDLKQYCERLKAIDPTKTTGLECNWIESYNGTLEKLVANTITTDIPFVSNFVGKVYQSTIENPNIFKWFHTTTLLAPNSPSWVEGIQTRIEPIKTLNNVAESYSTTTLNAMPQHLFSFNIIEILERRLGKSIWGTASLLSEKIVIAKSLIKKLTIKWYGYGSSPTGNRATLSIWRSNTNAWVGLQAHTSNTVTLLTGNTDTNLWIDTMGFTYYLAHAEPSNGTVASVINTDYVELELTLDLTKL